MVVSGTQVNVFTDVNALFGLAFGLALERGFFPFNEFFDGLVKFLQLLVCDAINVTVADGDAVGCFALVHGVGRLFLFYLPGALRCIVLFFIHNSNVLKSRGNKKNGSACPVGYHFGEAGWMKEEKRCVVATKE